MFPRDVSAIDLHRDVIHWVIDGNMAATRSILRRRGRPSSCLYVHRRMRRGGRGGLQPPPPSFWATQFFGQRRSFFWAAAMVGGGCFSIFRRANDVTQTMSKGGGGACEIPPFRKSCIRPCYLCKILGSQPLRPP